MAAWPDVLWSRRGERKSGEEGWASGTGQNELCASVGQFVAMRLFMRHHSISQAPRQRFRLHAVRVKQVQLKAEDEHRPHSHSRLGPRPRSSLSPLALYDPKSNQRVVLLKDIQLFFEHVG